MASTLLGSLLVNLGLESGQFKSGLSDAEKRMRSTQRKFQKIGKNMVGLGKTMSLSITAPFAAFAASSVKVAADARDAFAQVEASLASMGDGAGRTAEQLRVAGKELQNLSTFDDAEILREVTSVMLTFGNVAETQFDRAQRAAVDMATKLKVDLKSATIQIGKALNDPVKGISALTRVGIDFTKQQKDQIKAMAESGDLAGAQSVILAELERQFKGAGKAARDAVPGSEAINKWNDLREKVGEVLLKAFEKIEPVLTKIADAFLNLSPEMQAAATVIAAVVAAGGPLLIFAGAITGAIGTLLPVLAKLGPALSIIRIALLAIAANPVILALSAVIAGIYLAWKNWDKIEPVVRRVYKAVKEWVLDKLSAVWDAIKAPIMAYIQFYSLLWRKSTEFAQKLYMGVKTWLMDKLAAVWRSVTDKIDEVKRAFFNLYDAVVGNSYIPDMVNEIAAQMRRLDVVMVGQAGRAAGRTENRFREMAETVRELLSRLYPESERLITYRDDLRTIDAMEVPDDRKTELRARAGRLFRGEPLEGNKAQISSGLLNTGPILVATSAVNEAISGMAQKGKVQTVRLAKSFADMAEEISGSLRNLVSAIKGGGFFDILDGVLGLFKTLGSSGLLGKSVQTRLNLPIPGFANGTNFAPGGLAIVGERGPELVNLPRGSQVMANRELAGLRGGGVTNNYYTLPSDEFWSRVDGRAGSVLAQAAPSIIAAGGEAGVSRMNKLQNRRLG